MGERVICSSGFITTDRRSLRSNRHWAFFGTSYLLQSFSPVFGFCVLMAFPLRWFGCPGVYMPTSKKKGFSMAGVYSAGGRIGLG
jgi:hypothetical protein